jgi:hypothetical protein
MKPCTKCGVLKDETAFSVDRSKKDGRHGHCKECQSKRAKEKRQSDPEYRARCNEKSRQYRKTNREQTRASQRNAYLKWKYGITTEDYNSLMQSQKGACAICKAPESSWGKFAVDHCHQTGRVRGLLCFNCNTSIGKMNDDPSLLRRAAEYLEASSNS